MTGGSDDRTAAARTEEETMVSYSKISRGLRLGAIAGAVLLLAAACSAGAPAPSGGGGGATKHVAILNKELTDDQIKAEVAKEGSLVVGNWTYTANDELVKQFTAVRQGRPTAPTSSSPTRARRPRAPT